ncbi:MAG: hypothetical protein E7470_05365 [Ruminococcaceae bacterium]|nr:hypothetical protein [Oscillospiraceae bacterium]
MVKGVSRQVIVVHSPDPELFEQAIFILKDDVVRDGVTQETLLQEAKRVLRQEEWWGRKQHPALYALVGAVAMGVLWTLSLLL